MNGMNEWYGYPQQDGAQKERPWWRYRSGVWGSDWARSDGLVLACVYRNGLWLCAAGREVHLGPATEWSTSAHLPTAEWPKQVEWPKVTG